MSRVPPLLGPPAPLWDMRDGPMPRGILGLSDPDVHHIDDRWVMHIGGVSVGLRNRLYRFTLPPGVGLGSSDWHLDRDERGRPRPLVPDAGRGCWDSGGMHTPSYVPAHLGHPARLYYAGRRSSKRHGPGSAYSVGVLEEMPTGGWRRLPEPVLSGDAVRPSAFEPTVIAVPEGYRMWFLAAPHEVGKGEQPDFELRVSDSEDGLVWQTPRVFATVEEGFFDNALLRTPDGWGMILARGTNLHGTRPYPAQGLWWSSAATPSADRGRWSAPVRILDTDDPATASWLGHGVCGPSVGADATGRVRVYFTGTHRTVGWLRLAVERLRSGRRPPVPAPYHLATGAADLSLP